MKPSYSNKMTRRNAFSSLLPFVVPALPTLPTCFSPTPVFANSAHALEFAEQTSARALGLLIGGLVGDALGGPLEFSGASAEATKLTDARNWSDDRKLDAAELARLAESLPMHGYEQLRPTTAPYGPWIEAAPLGTLTDDSRHKIILLRAVREQLGKSGKLDREAIARSLVGFEPKYAGHSDQELRALNEEGFREYRYAANWLLGKRDPNIARPVERLWGGVNNCSGQIMFPPLAVGFAGDAAAAYKATFQLDFIDTPLAREIASSINAALAEVLDARWDEAAPAQRWEVLLDTLRNVDPYGQKEVPFAGRQLDRWLDRTDAWVQKAAGCPKVLFRLLETEGKPEYWWDAHFTLIVPLSILKLCNFAPLAAMHLTLDFGHDTDSYAQVLGCLLGAVHGEAVFPKQIREAVRKTLQVDYDETVEQWLQELKAIEVGDS